jgi:hypothetical protein
LQQTQTKIKSKKPITVYSIYKFMIDSCRHAI